MDAEKQLPHYACAIIRTPDQRFLLQLRPTQATFAANQLTCFGGRREAHENTEQCLYRELQEELHWTPSTCTPICDLRDHDQFIARFFYCPVTHVPEIRTEPDHIALWLPSLALYGLPLSPWHLAVISAVQRGQRLVYLND